MGNFSQKIDKFIEIFIDQNGYVRVVQGLQNTLLIAVCGLIIGILIGTIIATVRVLPKYKMLPRVLNGFCSFYVALFRGTPMVVQLLIVHFALFPAIGLNIPAEVEGTIAFGMNSGAYICEIMRGGILSVDKGQMEAGRALGLGYGRTMIKIVLPQAVKNVVPTLGNEFIALIKETSVVSFIAVVDVTRAFQAIANSTFKYILSYLMLAAVYLVLVLIVTLIIRIIERRLRASDRR